MLLKSLLVCPDAETVEVLCRILKELDIEAEVCTEMVAAGSQLLEHRFDAVLVDCENVAIATEILKKTRGSARNGGTMIVALVKNQEHVRQVFAAGANFVLYKPISLDRARSSLQAARGLMRRERRRSNRVPVNARVALAYANVENAPATLVDLSEDGGGVQCLQPLPAGHKLYFQFTLPGHTEQVRVSGEVTWQDARGRVGVHFSHVPQASGRLLKNWLRTNGSRQSVDPRPALPRFSTPANIDEQDRTAGDAGLARFRAAPGNRRGQSRHACLLGAEVYRCGTVVPHRCQLSDISVGGCYVEMPTPFTAETRVEIVVRTRDLKISTQGVVQSVHPGYGMGVKFNSPSDQERGEIQQLISLLHSQQVLDPIR